MTYHSEVVGSLLRPTYLVDARKQLEAGQITPAQFKAMEGNRISFEDQRRKLELVASIAREAWG